MRKHVGQSLCLLALGNALCGCAPRMDVDEVSGLLTTQGPGLVANIELGQTWSEIVAKHDRRLTVTDLPSGNGRAALKQLRYDLGSGSKLGSDGFYITFSFEGERLKSYELHLRGEKQNRAAIAALASSLTLRLHARLGATPCADSAKTLSCWWIGKGADGGAKLLYAKPNSEGWSWITVTVDRDYVQRPNQ